jgi:hypothetical protein
MADPFGNRQPYFIKDVFNAIYYCKDRRLVYLEHNLGTVLQNTSQFGIPKFKENERRKPKKNLCVFIPVTFRIPGSLELAEAVLILLTIFPLFVVRCRNLKCVFEGVPGLKCAS